MQSTKFDLLTGLRSGGGETRRRGRARAVFVVAQLAMSIVLLATAGLFVRAVTESVALGSGLDAEGVVVSELNLAPHGYDRVRGQAYFDELVRRLRRRPEVAAAGLGLYTPLSLGHSGEVLKTTDGRQVQVTWGIAGEGYLETVGIRVVAGRAFTDRDTPASPPAIVVNETMAQQFWPGQPAVGQRVRLGGDREVIGVIRDGKYRSPDEGPTAYALVPLTQSYSGRMVLHVRARLDEARAQRALHEEVAAMDANVALENRGSLARQLEIYSLPQRVAAACIGLFGLVGVLLAAIGIHGVIAYHVAQRTREVGIRVALGARSVDIAGAVLREAMVLVGIALLIGIPLSLAVGRLARSLLLGVSATDPVTLASVCALLAVVALVAGSAPARRAARVDPVTSLRAD